MSRKVLIYVDQKRRDLYPMMRIYEELSANNFDVKISGKLDFLCAVMVFRPNIIIFGKADGYHGDWLRSINGAIIFSIHTEQGYESKEDTIWNFIGGHNYVRPPAHERVDYHLLGSRTTMQHLSQYLPANKMVVIGYPRLMTDSYAIGPRKVSGKLTIGFAVGENIGDANQIYNLFVNYLNKSMGYLSDIRGYLSFGMLDRCFNRHLIDILKEKYPILVRYRFGDKNYPIDKTGLSIDLSDDPRNFIQKSDLIIIGQTTLGVESMMCGVPVISTVRLLNVNGIFDSVASFSYIDLCWQPNTIDELLDLITKRSKNELDLSPKMDIYSDFVSRTYYTDGSSDNSMKNILNLAQTCNVKGEAELDIVRLKGLLKTRYLKIMLLRFCGGKYFGNLIYNVYISYLKIRHLLNKNYSEEYVPEISLLTKIKRSYQV